MQLRRLQDVLASDWSSISTYSALRIFAVSSSGRPPRGKHLVGLNTDECFHSATRRLITLSATDHLRRTNANSNPNSHNLGGCQTIALKCTKPGTPELRATPSSSNKKCSPRLSSSELLAQVVRRQNPELVSNCPTSGSQKLENGILCGRRSVKSSFAVRGRAHRLRLSSRAWRSSSPAPPPSPPLPTAWATLVSATVLDCSPDGVSPN